METQLAVSRPGALLSCTWGAGGATLALKHGDAATEWAEVEAWKPEAKKPLVEYVNLEILHSPPFLLTYRASRIWLTKNQCYWSRGYLHRWNVARTNSARG